MLLCISFKLEDRGAFVRRTASILYIHVCDYVPLKKWQLKQMVCKTGKNGVVLQSMRQMTFWFAQHGSVFAICHVWCFNRASQQHTAAPLRTIIYLVAALGKYLYVQPVAVFGGFQMPTTGLCVFLRTTVRELLMLLLTLINEIMMQAISSSCLRIILCAFPPHFCFFGFLSFKMWKMCCVSLPSGFQP